MQQYREANVSLSSTPSVLCPYDPTRKTLIISNSVTATPALVANSPGTLQGANANGINITSTVPLILDVKTHGIAVVNAWYGRVSGATGAVYVGEVYDPTDPWPTPPSIENVQNGTGSGYDPVSVEGIDRPDPIVELTSELLRMDYARPEA